jgi:hypothetical protein
MDELKRRARQQYETARLWQALPWGAVGLVAGGVAVWRGAAYAGVFAVLLSVVVVALRWRGQTLARGVLPGLVAGSIGYAAPLIYASTKACCAGSACGEWCTLVCALGGLGTGLVLSRSVLRGPDLSFALSVSIVAGLTAAIGCSTMGWVGLVGVVVGWVVSAPVLVFRQYAVAS